MKLFKWSEKDGMSQQGYMVQVNPEETAALIQSLATQLVSKSPNSGRREFQTEDKEYFSIAVKQHEPFKPGELEIEYAYDRIKEAGRYESGELRKILKK